MPVADDVRLGPGVEIPYPELTNLYGCTIGAGTRIGPFVEIQSGVVIGERCKIQSHTFICTGVTIEDEVFVGHGVMFVNDKNPRAVNDRGELAGPEDWKMVSTLVRRGVSIGSNATILGDLIIGEGALVGAGAVVTKDVRQGAVVAGSPAREIERGLA
jgi:acetyltransferase-like isoleucine patch superfamily enzyme